MCHVKNYGLVRVEHKPTGYVSWDAVMYWFMDKEGYLVGDPDKIMVDIFDPDMKKHDDIAEGLAGLAPFALKAISYLHQNGEVEEVTPSRQQRRKMQRTYKIEPTKHYILKVGQVHGRSIQESDIGKPVKQKRRKGIVRGHFKFYGSEYGRGKLFGKYEGAIFIPAHERGDDTVGRIQKDYKISGNSANS